VQSAKVSVKRKAQSAKVKDSAKRKTQSAKLKNQGGVAYPG